MSTSPCEDLPIEDSATSTDTGLSRRTFVKAAGVLSAGVATGLPGLAEAEVVPSEQQTGSITLMVNGESKSLSLDTRTSLLDALREHMGLTGSK